MECSYHKTAHHNCFKLLLNSKQEVNKMETQMREENKTLVRAFNEAVDKRDYDALDKFIAEDFHRHSAASPEANATNREEMKAFLQANEKTFPDVQNIIGMMVAEGDMVAVYATFTPFTQPSPVPWMAPWVTFHPLGTVSNHLLYHSSASRMARSPKCGSSGIMSIFCLSWGYSHHLALAIKRI